MIGRDGVEYPANKRMHLTRSAMVTGTAALAGDPQCSSGRPIPKCSIGDLRSVVVRSVVVLDLQGRLSY